MTQLIRLEDGFVFEVEGDRNVGLAASGGDAQAVSGRIDDALATLRTLVARFDAGWNDFSNNIDVVSSTVRVKLGVTAKGNFFVAQGEASANLEVEIAFKAKARPDEAGKA